MAYDRLSAQDTVFLRIEKPNQPQHVGSLSLFEAGPLRGPDGRLRIDDLRSFIEGRLPRVPRLRQRLMEVPYGQGRPIWVDDDRFDLSYHVRVTGLPQPGDHPQLLELMSRIQSQALDRERPLWELWFVDGIEGDRMALIIRTHHALGDGIANVDLALALVDLAAEPVHEPPAPAWAARPSPSSRRLLRDSLVERLGQPLRLAQAMGGATRAPRKAATSLFDLGRTLVTFASAPAPAPWNTPVTRHRRWTTASVPMSVVRDTKEAAGCTLNDVVLAACTGALRGFLDVHGVAARPLKAMVPVSRRLETEHGDTLGNRVSLIIVDLPLDVDDPAARLHRVHQQTSELKGSGLVDGAEAVLSIVDEVPLFAAPLTRFVSQRIPMNLVITNIPGPPVPLFMRGARLLEAYPYVEVVDNEGLTIAVVSYDDQLFFGVTADRDVVPDLEVLTSGIEAAFAELADAVSS